jgi:GMP synthase (glutamine-hydrolysing)
LITGSKFAAYENHEWIPPLEDFLRQAYYARVPIIGVCFGHQIFAQALGGTVKQFSGGWSVGAVDYQVADLPGEQTIMAWHQDQVVELPEDAKVIGRSDFCQYAMLAYGDRALTIQPHPEFTADFLADLLAARRNALPDEVANRAADGLTSTLTSPLIADRFEAFFKVDRDKRDTR